MPSYDDEDFAVNDIVRVWEADRFIVGWLEELDGEYGYVLVMQSDDASECGTLRKAPRALLSSY